LLSLDSKDEEDMLSDVKRASCNQDHSSVERNEKRRPAWDHDCWWGHRHILFGRRGTAVLQATYFITHRHSILGGFGILGHRLCLRNLSVLRKCLLPAMGIGLK